MNQYQFNVLAGPALNRMYKISGHRMYKTRECKTWVADCWAEIVMQLGAYTTLTGDVRVDIEVRPKDRRLRDIDGYLKATLDMLETVGLIENDRQITQLNMIRKAPPNPEHSLVIRLQDLPVHPG